MKSKWINLIPALLLCHCAIAQPLFLVPQPTCTEVQVNVLAPNIFDSYLWDFGNGETANIYQPPAIAYATTGNKTISLTVSAATPFRVVEAIQVTQYHPDSWNDNGLFCSDYKPDLYLVFTDLAGYVARSYEIEDAPLSSTFAIDGMLTQASFPIKAWDADGIWCGANDFLGSVAVPANSTGGTFSNAAYQLTLVVKTKLVTSATWTQTFFISDTLPDKPEISCTNDILVSSYSGSNRWLDANLNEIPGAINQAFNPTLEGFYSVKYIGSACHVIYDPVYFVPGSCIVTATNTPGEEQQSLKVYPNPASGPINVQLPAGSSDDISACRLFSIDGRLSADVPYTRSGDGLLRVDLSGRQPGVWVLQLATKSGVYTQKVILVNGK
ncbi:MAG: T9SS type A sorting domain-containing protein [Lewinellaceae bacterium]|nr:T9SS type A sorting domain-containing protein [Lewinellaceae bacterium]